jgi:hypothetical protein
LLHIRSGLDRNVRLKTGYPVRGLSCFTTVPSGKWRDSEINQFAACRAVAMQRPRDKQTYQSRFYERLGKRVPAATSMYATIEYCWKRGVSTWTLLRCYKQGRKSVARHPRVEAGSNTSTVTLRVVGGDGKGSLESETVKYGHESYGTRTRK